MDVTWIAPFVGAVGAAGGFAFLGGRNKPNAQHEELQERLSALEIQLKELNSKYKTLEKSETDAR